MRQARALPLVLPYVRQKYYFGLLCFGSYVVTIDQGTIEQEPTQEKEQRVT